MSKEPDSFHARIKARTILKKLKISSSDQLSVEDIAWLQGALVIEEGLTGADARLVYTPGVKPAILRVNSALRPNGRKRFAIAHELGHLEMGHNPGAPTECNEEDFVTWYKGQHDKEVEANIFAAELLMPEDLFVASLARTVPSMDLIQSLADQFQTTLTATAIRYIDLCEEPCAAVYSVSGRVRWAKQNPLFHGWISRGQPLSGNTIAADFFEGNALAEEMTTVRKDAWIPDSSPRQTLKEQSIAMPRYDAVLSLLWDTD